MVPWSPQLQPQPEHRLHSSSYGALVTMKDTDYTVAAIYGALVTTT